MSTNEKLPVALVRAWDERLVSIHQAFAIDTAIEDKMGKDKSYESSAEHLLLSTQRDQILAQANGAWVSAVMNLLGDVQVAWQGEGHCVLSIVKTFVFTSDVSTDYGDNDEVDDEQADR